jgi:adenine-specific DNA-methyltransferase
MLAIATRPDQSNIRQLGQVFTPLPVADWMAAWVCEKRPSVVLDPALGKGVFVDAIAKRFERMRGAPRIDAFEIDRSLAAGYGPPAGIRTRVRAEDFITATIARRYPGIIANPPYVRHHDHDYDQTIWQRFDRQCGVRLSRATNLYGLFLARIWSLLDSTGRAAVIAPVEWINADFGRPLKAYLLRENAIEAIISFGHAHRVFADAMTTAAIVLLRRGRQAHDPIRLAQVRDFNDLSRLDLRKVAPITAMPDPQAKWMPLFESSIRPAAGRILGDVARCMRGIATGANSYFALRPSELREWRIDRRDVRTCIARAQQLRKAILTPRMIRSLECADERIMLLSPRSRINANLDAYLKHGTKMGIHRRYLPAHRPCWYAPENREPAPILISVFTRGPFRVVWNGARALNLTAYHGIYPRSSDDRFARRLFDYLRGNQGQSQLRHHCRIYADGLFKVEPRDVEAISIPERLFADLFDRRRRA